MGKCVHGLHIIKCQACIDEATDEGIARDKKRIAQLEEDLLDAVSRCNTLTEAIEDAVYKHRHTACPPHILIADLEGVLEQSKDV